MRNNFLRCFVDCEVFYQRGYCYYIWLRFVINVINGIFVVGNDLVTVVLNKFSFVDQSLVGFYYLEILKI